MKQGIILVGCPIERTPILRSIHGDVKERYVSKLLYRSALVSSSFLCATPKKDAPLLT